MTDVSMTEFERAIRELADTISARAESATESSYTSQLLQAGPGKCAKKLGEEGVELALAIASGSETEVANEAADLLYHLLVALKSRSVSPDTVGKVLLDRQGMSGLAEKASRPTSAG